MSASLYNEQILALASGLTKQDRLDAPQVTVQVTSPLCGSRIQVDLCLTKDGCIADYGQDVRACALGQASASLMKQTVLGKSREEIAVGKQAVTAMLKQDAAPPKGDWATYDILAAARAHKSRHASILLPFDAVLQAFDLAAASQNA